MQGNIMSILAFANTVAAHGYVSSPPARQVGNASVAACGQSVVNNIKADNTSHVEGLPELAANDNGYNSTLCNLWQCRGIQYADNLANVQKYTPGQVVNLKVKLTIPHTGNANVSVVDTRTNKILGKPLISWAEGYADEKAFYGGTTPKGQIDFNVTIPSDLGNACTDGGSCILQWWWYGTGARQSYESCVDFTVTTI
ncbi:hypothetical protein BKA67DRAFT_518183 [Truncatella angustata]|uniref:Chitin-binding type-4 domain-containing protein n=1 Tax=Truncatella angustata TaxID=152316 RepID=A0A9P8UMD4_9PEZI|nr:uncharacterized protein BKA67DRAFT_518183 [Truncatella angustata]KAH6654806.1 hypothetical protein BKA67DRAFT_518183 [Truncatella angustata]KAH8197237.1 hypothetical protein TruAng_008595 [Truncatella angustata]